MSDIDIQRYCNKTIIVMYVPQEKKRTLTSKTRVGGKIQ